MIILFFSNNFYSKRKVKYQDTHIFWATLTYSPNACPCCGGVNESNSIVKNGFKSSNIKFLPISNLPAILVLKKQRFFCRNCDSSFMASSNFIDPYCNISNDVKKAILKDLMSVSSIKDISKRCNVSSSSVLRVLKTVRVLRKDFSYLPEFICMDEFKSVNNLDSNMSFVCMDAVTREIIDILPDRRIHKLILYFQRFPIELRRKVKGVVIDMYEPYISLIKELFVNAKIIIDRFHIVGLFSRSFNQIRVDTMKTYSNYSLDYKKLKKYWKLFLKPYRLLSSTVLSKKIHFPGRYISQLDVVNESISVDKVLEDSYSCYQIIRQDIENRDFDSFERHLIYFRERVGFKMQVPTFYS